MYKPKYRISESGAPILSRKEIEMHAERLVRDFQPGALFNAQPFDIGRFLEIYLELNLDFMYLSSTGIYMGMYIADETSRLPIYNPMTNRAEYTQVDTGTVIIDRRLIENSKMKHPLQFTMAHEGSHAIYHQKYVQMRRTHPLFRENHSEPVILCRTQSVTPKNDGSDPHSWTDDKRIEWQANASGSCLLMPRPAVRKLFEINGRTGGRCRQIIKTIRDLSRECVVSEEAAAYRLKDIGLVDRDELRSYLPGSPLMQYHDLDY